MRGILIMVFLTCTSRILISQVNEVNRPIKNFEKLWMEFDLRYANFHLKEVDWNNIYTNYRPQVTENTTNIELFEICCKMLQELNDGHVFIEPNFEEKEIECGPPYTFQLDTVFKTRDEWDQLMGVIDRTLVEEGFSEPVRFNLSEETNFQYRLSESLSYLRLDEMTENYTFGKFERVVDKVIKASREKEGLIIDLRFNGGGWDHASYILASRFVPMGKELGHYKKTKVKGTEKFKKLTYRRIRPKGRDQFTGPVVILTSDYTASAAEVFILLLEDLPNMTIIGDTTEGIFSDMYEFKLPNKWLVSLSHQQFFSKDNINYEGVGIPPDILLLNTKKDIRRKTDSVVEKAIMYLTKKNKR